MLKIEKNGLKRFMKTLFRHLQQINFIIKLYLNSFGQFIGIPGPTVTQNHFREAIDTERKKAWRKKTPYKAYVDVFRRIESYRVKKGLQESQKREIATN